MGTEALITFKCILMAFGGFIVGVLTGILLKDEQERRGYGKR